MRKNFGEVLSYLKPNRVATFIGWLAIIKPILQYFFQWLNAVSNFDFAISAGGNPRMVEAWNFLASPIGNLVFTAAGICWLAFFVWQQTQKADKADANTQLVTGENLNKLTDTADNKQSMIESKTTFSKLGILNCGVMYEEDGKEKMLAGAVCIAENEETKRKYSGTQGNRALNLNVPYGRYSVTANAEGFLPHTEYAIVGEDEDSHFEGEIGVFHVVLQRIKN